jgi:DNA-binding IclR family transcriptional regulator
MEAADATDEKRPMNSAMEKGVALMETLGESPRGLSTTEMAALTGLPKQTVHRVARQLEELGLIARQLGSDRFVVAGRLRRLGRTALMAIDQTQVIHQILSDLVAEIGETCNIGVLDGTEVIYIDRVECHWPLRVQLRPGSKVPVHCTAIGKLLLAHLGAERLGRLIPKLSLTRYTPNTIIAPDALGKALEEIRADGYSVNAEEDSLGLAALAVPIRNAGGEVCAGLAVHAPTARLSLTEMIERRPLLEAAAHRLADELFSF